MLYFMLAFVELQFLRLEWGMFWAFFLTPRSLSILILQIDIILLKLLGLMLDFVIIPGKYLKHGRLFISGLVRYTMNELFSS